jgi:hypothetical protein
MSFKKRVYSNKLILRKDYQLFDYSQFLKTAKNSMSSCFKREN